MHLLTKRLFRAALKRSQYFALLTAPLSALLILGILQSEQSHAATATISCSDTSDAQSCSVSPNNSFGFEYVANLVNNVNSCRQADDANRENASIICDAGELGTIECSTTANSASCQLPDQSTLICSYQEEGESSQATCSLSSEGAINSVNALAEELELTAFQATTLNAIATTCASRSGSSNFQNDCDALLAAARSSDANFKSALEAITPQTISAAFDSMQASLDAQNRNLNARLEMLRHMIKRKPQLDLIEKNRRNSEPDSLESEATHDSIPSPHQSGGNAGSDRELDADQSAGLIGDNSRISTFFNSTTLNSDKTSSTTEAGSDSTTQAVTLGLDYRAAPNLALGIAFGLTNTSSDLDNQLGDLDNQTFNITGFGQYYFDEHFYIDSTLTYAGSAIDQDRNIQYALSTTIVDQTAKADYFASVVEFTLGSGYEWIHQAWNLNGFAQLSSRQVDVESYRERLQDNSGSGAGWGLTVDQQNFDSLQLSMGLQTAYTFSQPWGLLMPAARIEWVSELEDDPRSVSFQFSDDLLLQQKISVDLNEVDTQYFQIGLGLTAVLTQGHFAYAYWQGTQGLDNLDQNMITLGWRWEI